MQKIFEFGISLSFINDDNDVDKSFTVILDLDENNTADQKLGNYKTKIYRSF